MNPASIRRVSIAASLVLVFVFFWLWNISQPLVENEEPKIFYKVRAYTTSRDQAVEIKKLGQQFDLQGSLSKNLRKTKKFMGYVVTQDFLKSKSSNSAQYVNEYLKSEGYKTTVMPGSDPQTIRIRVGETYPSPEEAQKVADSIYKLATVTFEVKEYYKEVFYRTFVVVFQNIENKETAQKLKDEIEVITSDVEMVSY